MLWDQLPELVKDYRPLAFSFFRRKPPYVGENIHPDEGYWIARQQMYWGGQRNANSPSWGDAPTQPTPDRERSVDYMHSTFIDNVLGGLLARMLNTGGP